MVRDILVLSLLLLPTLGCTQMVGGTCSYETIYGTAQIVKLQDDHTFAQFNPGQQNFSSEKVPFSRNFQFTLRQSTAGKIGSIYPARLSIITEGSCTPYQLGLLATENYSTGQFLPVNDNGQLSSEADQDIDQIATTFKQLAKHWPQLKLSVCGQTASPGTQEYNRHLGERYARQFAHNLEKAGVPAEQMQITSYGESPCPRCNAFSDELQNGAWLSFQMTGADDLSTKETKNTDYLRDTARQGHQESLDILIAAAGNGDTEVQLFLGDLYAYGAGVQQNDKKALNCYSKAAELGNSDAMFKLGQAYHDGVITPENPGKAMYWYLKSAQQGNSSAYFRLGHIYDLGELVPKNQEKTIFWFTKAAEAGFDDARVFLSEIHNSDKPSN